MGLILAFRKVSLSMQNAERTLPVVEEVSEGISTISYTSIALIRGLKLIFFNVMLKLLIPFRVKNRAVASEFFTV